MKTMAEVIMLHSPIGRDEDGQYCKGCNHRYGYAADRQLHHRASAHIAVALVGAGYGPVREAAAEALRDAAEDAEGMYDPIKPDCQEWADWLRVRAELVNS